MTLIDLIRKWGGNKKEKSVKFKQMEEDYRLQKMLEDRQKSSNERELERYMKEQREKEIKVQLDKIHDKQNAENWKGTNLNNQKSILKTDRPILKEKNIFENNENMFTKEHMMENKTDMGFFKW